LISSIRSIDGVARTETTVVLSTHIERVQLGLRTNEPTPPPHSRRNRRANDGNGHLRRA
jgi:hypothetical protein